MNLTDLLRPARSFLALALAALGVVPGAPAAAAVRPNILWLTSEDNGPELGCYGDAFAVTPRLDALAARGVRFLNCWSTAPVCAPARTTLLTGVYPTSTGAQHMRSEVPLPAALKTYPEHLRAAGYYCINPGKTDYNYAGDPRRFWDDDVPVAELAAMSQAGKPFMAVYNFTTTHESQVRARPHTPVHDPARVRVPPYHPDTEVVRRDWAQYYDKITEMDAQVGAKLDEFEQAGLLENTVVFYYGDHGSGMPRSKRWLYQSGLRVPLIVVVPEAFRDLAPGGYTPGGEVADLVGFVDFAPTLLSLAGTEPPAEMQGAAFLGPHAQPGQPYLYGFRDRMDERYDMSRTVRDQRFHYIRNYFPNRPYGQFLDYMFQTPTTREWSRLFGEGSLDETQSAFWRPKPPEELYDLEADPDEIRNLAGDPAHADTLARLRRAHEEHVFAVRDLGFLPEGEIHSRGGGQRSPYEVARDPREYPLVRIQTVAAMASANRPAYDPLLAASLADPDSAVRFWAATGLAARGPKAVATHRDALAAALDDASPYVRTAAAEALARYGGPEDATAATEKLLAEADVVANGLFRAMAALNSLAFVEEDRLRPFAARLRALPRQAPGVPQKMGNYIDRLLDRLTGTLEAE
jgi:uncharacterized sulfatase